MQNGHVGGISLLAACRMLFSRGQPRAWRTAELTLEPRFAIPCPAQRGHNGRTHISPVIDERWSMTFRTLRHAAR